MFLGFGGLCLGSIGLEPKNVAKKRHPKSLTLAPGSPEQARAPTPGTPEKLRLNLACKVYLAKFVRNPKKEL